MHSPLRIGIVGLGRIAGLQVLGYRDHPHARIVALCDRDLRRLQSHQQQWAVSRAYTDYVELCADPEIDAVDVLVPHHLHFPIALEALRHGKHVSLQKPPTLTIADLQRLADAAAANGVRLRVFENFMYYPPHTKARELIDAGAIGEPLSVRIKTAAGRPHDGWTVPADAQTWRMNPQTCGGGPTCFDHGYHCFNMGRFFIREPVERVHAWIHVNRFNDGIYDGPALISWKYRDVPKFGSWEVIASIGLQVRSKYYASDDRIEIHGTDGIIWINRCTGALLDEPALVLYARGETRAWHDVPTDWAESFRLGGIDFVDALLDGREPAQSAVDAAATLQFAIAAHVSACERREVRLNEVTPTTRAELPVDPNP